MKRVVAISAIVVGSLFGLLPGVDKQAEAHTVGFQESANICNLIRVADGWNGWVTVNAHTIHYGTAHVTQCDIRAQSDLSAYVCYQYIWGDPHVYYYDYGHALLSTEPCW